MTTLAKPLTRRVETDHGRCQIALTIHPGGLLELREKGARQSYSITLLSVYQMAVELARPAKRGRR